MNEFEQGMRRAGKLAGKVLKHAGTFVKPGITTLELDSIINKYTTDNGGINACIGYRGYPYAACFSVNTVLCHGTPNDVPLKDGDIVNIDVTVIVDGHYGDTSATFGVGKISEEAESLILVAHRAMVAGIYAARANGFTGDIGYASWQAAEVEGMTTADGIGGHGIGKQFHMAPHIPGKSQPVTGEVLRAGQFITIEPIVMLKPSEIRATLIPGSMIHLFEADTLSAQFEHTVMITDIGCEILTLP